MLTYLVISLVLAIVLLLIPIRIKIEGMPFYLFFQWFFFRIVLIQKDEEFVTRIGVFDWTTEIKKKEKKAPQKKEKVPKKKRKPSKKKTKRKLQPGEWLEILNGPEVLGILRQLVTILLRSVKSFTIFKFFWEISLEDPYRQGVLCGVLANLPNNRRFQVGGNFFDINAFYIDIYFSLIKFFLGIILFLVLFPYVKAFRLIRLIRKGRL